MHQAGEEANKTNTSAAASELRRVTETTKMKRRSVLVLLIVAFVGCNLLLGVSYNTRSTSNSSASDQAYGTVELNGRRIKGKRHDVTDRKTRGLQNVRTDDYQPVDPSPSSKAIIRPGPIEHGAPILPYVPRYTPSPPPAQSPPSPGKN